ncbi:hypothetical protein RND71_016118 [Anisodus tanguticus]|uniref:30S ribosomal protein S11 n=1 Tax=Anisodus tanguticus TaxID=243964 RepID=A0AAE1S7M4_9SOLA|nr:hypothetical protein RND71_016118 [Anisodus tanguticus]
MVLWEITLGTAYFLGLKRTYKLFLRIQHKLFSPKYPRLRDFAQRASRRCRKSTCTGAGRKESMKSPGIARCPKEAEMGNNSRPMDFVRGLMEDNTRGVLSGAPLSSYHIEQDVDIVHIKVLRNNAFITVTDSKGNKKFGATAGKLTAKGGKVARYATESTADHFGREARDRGLRSVVMKGSSKYSKNMIGVAACVP